MQVRQARIAIFDQHLASLRVVKGATAKRYTHGCAGPWQSGDTRRWQAATFAVHAGRRRSVYDKKRQRHVEDNRTEFNCTPTQAK